MKFKRTFLSIILAALIVFVPQLTAFSQDSSESADTLYTTRSNTASVELTAEGFGVDNKNITPGSTFKFSFKLKNPSATTDVKNVTLRLSGGEALSISNDVDTIYKDSIAKGSTAEFSKSFYCSKSAESGMYPISVSATYSYTLDGETLSGNTEFNYTVKVTSPSTTTTQAVVGTPSLTATFDAGNKKIYPGDSFRLKLKLKNRSANQSITNINVRFAGGEAFSISKDVDTAYSGGAAAAASVSFAKTFVCNKSVEAGMHPITVSVTYEYTSGGEKQQGAAEFSYSVQTYTKTQSTTKPSVALTPQLLISDFSYGGKQINGGDVFNLGFTVKNNSKTTKIQNIVIKLSGGESFVVADGTDTLTLDSLTAGKSAGFSKSFQCLSAVPSGVYPITASVTFEYIEDSAKQQGASELTMSVPVVQPDRVQFNSIDLADKKITVNEESDCAFSIINTGQTKLANGTVKLIDENGLELSSAFIGNIEAGGQYTSNYTLPVTIGETGDKKLTLVFEYENENAQAKSIEQEFNVTVEEYFDPYADLTNDDTYTDVDNADSTPSLGAIIGIAVAVLVLLIILIIVIKKSAKKKKSKKGSDGFDEKI